MRSAAIALGFVALSCSGSGRPAPARPIDRDLDLAAAPSAPATRPAGAGAAELPWTDPTPRAAAGPVAERPAIYRGRPIDLDFKDVDLADVFRLLADVGGVNIVIADDVKGKVTLRMRRVPWDQALVTVVKVKRLELERSGSVYLVRTP